MKAQCRQRGYTSIDLTWEHGRGKFGRAIYFFLFGMEGGGGGGLGQKWASGGATVKLILYVHRSRGSIMTGMYPWHVGMQVCSSFGSPVDQIFKMIKSFALFTI